ncbi:helix-turn-helix domain-containing protein [Fuerstiella marisgermanici]|uniref:Helix-turn-helix domain protein n=1 Tax=Fuerstiella marisgermanici TaxID=1891926 RepID=A0A1P8WBV1_9PLAN|nr:helix-turn-helix domain-containing protein [Fuerstiella marisgermanici]APZ91550.1 Helix-turn-helix domain protein [Fuerstiella marisgermanici]
MATNTVRQVMEKYGVAQHTVLAWIKSGELKAVNVGVTPSRKKPRWRISDEALEEFEKARTNKQPQKPTANRRNAANENVTQYYK